MIIREATLSDLQAILDIYNYSVVHTTSVYSYKPHTMEMRKKWFDEKMEHHFPVLVAESEGKVIGFAAYGSFRTWPAYKYSVEHSVHIHHEFWRKGVARKLMQHLIDHARSHKVHIMIGGIDASNIGSIQFHKELGFEEVAHFKEVGYKFGTWLDLKFLQLTLHPDFIPEES